MCCFTKETIQPSTHCRWPTISRKASAVQEAWPPTQSPSRWKQSKPDEAIKRVLQNQNLCQQRHQNFTLPKEPALFSQEKGKSLPVHFMCQSDTCQSTHGSHGGSKDALRAAVQAGCRVLPPEGSGLTPPSSAPGPRGQVRPHKELNVLFYR